VPLPFPVDFVMTMHSKKRRAGWRRIRIRTKIMLKEITYGIYKPVMEHMLQA